MPKQSYTAAEAARALGISLDTLRRWDTAGKIRVQRDASNRRVVPVSEVERLQSARELARVVRPDGLAFVAFIPRVSGVAGLIERAARRKGQVSAETLRVAATSGVFRNDSDTGFQEGYYPRAGELEALLRAAGFEVLTTISLRSVAHRLEHELTMLDPAVRTEAEAVLAVMSTWPEVVASSGHALVIARVPRSDET